MSEDSVAEDQIAAFIDRILRLKAEADDIAADIKEIYAEAHANGLNKTRLGEIVTYLRKVEKDRDGVAEAEAIRDLYLEAYYRAKNKPHTHAYAREPKSAPLSTTEINEPQPPVSAAREGEGIVASALPDAPIQPGTANEIIPVQDAKALTVEAAAAVEPEPAQEAQILRPGPVYAEPGIIVMETVPPVGIVAHPFAACWPVNNIDVTGGVREPIVKLGNFIVDGRGRYFAARAAMIEYPVVQYAGDDLLMDMIQWNLRSRTLSPQARGLVMGKLQKLAPEREGEIEDLFLALAMEDRQAAE